MKRVFAFALFVCLLTSLLVFPASAEADPSGKCGDNLTWTLTERKLIISGTGPMYDYSEENPAPWGDLTISTCVIEDGVTSIGAYAFADCQPSPFYIAATVTEISERAFYLPPRFVTKSRKIYFWGKAPAIAENAFEDVSATCYYVLGWEASDRQDYGGDIYWEDLSVYLVDTPKMIYSLNEEITVNDFTFGLKVSEHQHTSIKDYIPQNLQIEPYDNSTCGEKSVKIIADNLEFTHTYYVTDGQSHLEHVKAEIPVFQYCTGQPIDVKPTVTIGNITLKPYVHYSLSYQDNTDVGPNAKVNITGIGEWEGYEETLSFHIIKNDISDGYISHAENPSYHFIGAPTVPDFIVMSDYTYKSSLEKLKDYTVICENNLNMGTACYRAIGTGNYYGSLSTSFNIVYRNQDGSIKNDLVGVLNGNLTDESGLNDEVYYSELVLPPGKFKGRTRPSQNYSQDSYIDRYAYYELYQIIGEEPVLVTTLETEYGTAEETAFHYDFSSVYEDAIEEGGAIYMLAYSWVDSRANVYSGILTLYIPAKVPDATAIEVAHLENDGDYSKEYLTVVGVDGNVGDVTWTSSDPSVATVEDGVVTLIKSGTLTITAQYGNLIVEVPCEVAGRSLTECDFFHFDTQTETAYVSCEHILMRDGTDYTCTVSSDGKVTEVTLTGTGLFSGQLVLQLDAETGEPLSHAHSFDSLCDGTCNQCDYTRQAAEHTPAESWTKNQTHHWHACTACGAKTDEAEHVLSPEDSEVCTVCGTLYIPGDIDCNMLVNRDDVVQLLLHVSMPDAFPIEVDADFTGDGTVNRDDVVQLLLHVSMPDAFPLPA